MYGLNTTYSTIVFDNIDKLVEHCLISGMDPNVEVTKDGVGIGENLIDFMDE